MTSAFDPNRPLNCGFASCWFESSCISFYRLAAQPRSKMVECRPAVLALVRSRSEVGHR